MKGDVITMTLPSKPEYLLAIRMAVSAIAERIGFTIDDIEDIKVASAEACTLLLSAGLDTIMLQITAGDGIEIQLCAKGDPIPAFDVPEGNELSQYLLEALVDKCTFIKEDDTVTKINIYKK